MKSSASTALLLIVLLRDIPQTGGRDDTQCIHLFSGLFQDVLTSSGANREYQNLSIVS